MCINDLLNEGLRMSGTKPPGYGSGGFFYCPETGADSVHPIRGQSVPKFDIYIVRRVLACDTV